MPRWILQVLALLGLAGTVSAPWDALAQPVRHDPAVPRQPATDDVSAVDASKAVASLGALNVNPAQVSVSGFSGGGFMAQQLGIAYSSRFMGVGAFAGGPYDCRRTQPTARCQGQGGLVPDIAPARLNIDSWSGSLIDPVADIARQRVYFFSGTYDAVVTERASSQAVNLYRSYAADSNIRYEKTIAAAHAFPTDFDHPFSQQFPCGTISLITNCNFDGAGASLQWFYGTLNPPNHGAPTGSLFLVDQGAFVPSGRGMDTVAWLYVPTACADGAACRLHVFLHGCGGGYAQIGAPAYAQYSGHRKWADTNNIVLLFPQTVIDTANPSGCFDYGPSGGVDFDQKSGVHISAIVGMVARVTSGYRPPPAAIEYHHAEWDHYFSTAITDEIAKLDSGVFAGWARTGESINVYPLDAPGAANVCRFFSTTFVRSSHFYTPFDDECAKVTHNPDWQLEGLVFALVLPDGSGRCAAGTQAVYRLFNDGQGGAPNHRYTTNLAIRSAMIDRGWTSEGIGTDGVIACAPG